MKLMNVCKYVGIALLIILLILSFCLYFICLPAPVYETNDIADYGIIKGNYDNETPKAFVSSFFPERIEEYFSATSYHYKAKKLDTYAYEMYLEFVIEDLEKYTEFLSDVIDTDVTEAFNADPTYQAYYISDHMDLYESNESKKLYIQASEVGLILFSNADHRVIFLALGVHDGGGTTTDELNFFFERFSIDPREFAGD